MTNRAGKPKSSQRTVRVFISSTFRDMQEEREELVKQVFPKLRKLCRERGVEFTDVDLRWGVTEERSERGEVLPICLAEIKKCRPYFICHLGNRYGSVLGGIDPELIEEQSWLKAHQQKSVTELEILHGVLENPEMKKHAFFYFRDSAVSEKIEQQLIKEPDYRAEPPESKDKLVALKESICDSGYRPHEYKNAQAFGDQVLEDLWKAIDKDYPEGTKPTQLERENMDHEAFAEARRKTYIGRATYDKQLNDHVAGSGEPLVLLGESGAGKSALIANWMETYRKAHPDDFLIARFIGGTPNSADYVTLLRGIMMEIKAKYEPEAANENEEDQLTRNLSAPDKEDDIPSDPEKVKEAFPGWLSRAAAMETKTNSRFILILDGLNQLNDRDNAPDLGWLPVVINSHVRLILSTLPGRSLDALQKRSWPTIAIEPLEITERDTFIVDYLARFGKELSDARRKRITQTQQSANPLYLRTLLEELRIFGIHEKLDEKIDHYLKAETVEALFTKVLERYEQDYEREEDNTIGLTRKAMSLIWAARSGLSEEELLELLGTDGRLLPQAIWSPLYLAAEESLVNRSGLLSFFHDYMRQAVQQRYLKEPKHQQKAHIRIADYFKGRELDRRKVDELPWQLQKAAEWKRLYELLSDLSFFEILGEVGRFDIMSYWSQVEANTSLRMVDAYGQVLEDPGLFKERIWQVARLLQETGQIEEALKLRQYLVDCYRKIGDRNNLATSLGNLALILHKMGNLDEAMKLYKMQEEICRDPQDLVSRIFWWEDALQRCLGNQANILKALGKLDGAMSLLKQKENICREHGNKEGLSISLVSQATILQERSNFDGAMDCCKQAEELSRSSGSNNVLQFILGKQAAILQKKGDFEGAMQFHKRKEEICRELGIRDELIVALGNQAVVLMAQGKLVDAMLIHKKVESLCLMKNDNKELAVCFTNQALTLERQGDLVEALGLFKKGEQIYREVGNEKGLLSSLRSQAVIQYRQSGADAAMQLHIQREKICKESGNTGDLADALGHQANIHYARGDLTKGLALHCEAEQIYHGIGDAKGFAVSLASQAEILCDMGRIIEAVPLVEEGYQVAIQQGLHDVAEAIKSIMDRV